VRVPARLPEMTLDHDDGNRTRSVLGSQRRLRD
jgi:hypothetical protein